ncbi:hypothetical protein EG329_005334 [Mollisiaceae sp. DMI_Dod_QoI]|nr:hypothetical protein EG329_005334 [Helotiales sp. DMI_Dod_QoI]
MPRFLKDLPYGDFLEALKSTAYIDLASVPVPKAAYELRLESTTKTATIPRGGEKIPIIVPGLDLADNRHKEIPGGLIQVVDREKLKLQGCTGEFVFYPALPRELRAKICHLTLPTRLIRAVEVFNSDGTTKYTVHGADRPVMCRVSKQAVEDVLAIKIYQPYFEVKAGGRKVYYNPFFDCVRVDSPFYREGLMMRAPQLAFPSALVKKADLEAIKFIDFDLLIFMVYLQWAERNIRGMHSLEEIALNAYFTKAQAVKTTYDCMMFKTKQGQESYTAIHLRGNVSLYDEVAIDSFCSGDIDPSWGRILRNLHEMLDQCLNNKKLVMPKVVRIVFWCHPAPAALTISN